MFIKIQEKLDEVKNVLSKVNALKKVPNNYVSIIHKNDKAEITLLENGEKVLELEDKPFKKLFSYRDNFIGEIDCDRNLLNVVTNIRLHGHTDYSLLDGMVKVKDLAKKTVYCSAIADHGVLYGAVDFYKSMKALNKKAIIGFEAYTDSIKGEVNKYHLVLLAKNEIGYKNLIKLCSKGQENYGGKFPTRPIVTHEELRGHNEGLVVLSACMGGEIPKAILNNDYDLAKEVAQEYQSLFGEDFYLEVQRHEMSEEEELNNQIFKLAEELNIKVVATDDAHYLDEEDAEIHESHLCNQRKTTMSDPKRWKFPGTGYHVHTIEQMEKRWRDRPEVLINSLEIMDKCNFTFKFGEYKLPIFDVPDGMTESEYLTKLTWEGFNERFPVGTVEHTSKEYIDRIKFELDVINNMGYPSYFLIVWDYINYAKENNIPVGPGRGSACGSLVTFCLKITDLNPIPYNLLFERFLSPDRISMPDIDVDFGDIKREKVIDYCKMKYGESAVSRIITFGTMAAKCAIKDMARIWDKAPAFGENICKLIPNTPKITIKKALSESVEFKNLYDTNPEVKDIVDKAMRFEGLKRNVSIHACGVIISSSDVTDYCPQVFLLNKDTGLFERTTQFTMGECEEIGLLKMDFLGLKTETVLDESVEDINNIYGKDLTIDTIPLDDVKVYEHIAKGHTKGMFQLEGNGMTSFMKQLFQDVSKLIRETKNLPLTKKVKEEKLSELGAQLFERMIAGISLYRPGPMDEIPKYIDNMLNPSHITYDTPQLEEILKPTYGIIVYQEQVMQTVRALAGFTKGQSDLMRKAMGKKIEEILDEYEPYFINGSGDNIDQKTKKKLGIKGCTSNGIVEQIAKRIWEKMRNFAKYAFNKSHAGGYGVIAVQTAFISFYYPVIFMKANLNAYITNPKKVKPYLAYCYKANIPILQPSINKSEKMFTVEGKEEGIRFGLKGIKNVGTLSELIIKEREANGLFKDYQDFVTRMYINAKTDTRAIESLIHAGALDEFEGTRRAKVSIIENLISLAKTEKQNLLTGQVTIFDIASEYGLSDLKDMKVIKTPDIAEFTKDYKLAKEREMAGFYITEHPLDEYDSILKTSNIIELEQLSVSEEEDEEVVLTEEDVEQIVKEENNYIGQIINVAGIVNEVEVRYTKKDNKPMYTFSIQDRTGDLRCVCFNRQSLANQDKLVEGKKVIINGVFDINDYGPQLRVNMMTDLATDNEISKEITVIGNSDRDISVKQWDKLKALANANKGQTQINFIFGGKSFDFPKEICLNWNVLDSIQEIFGEKNCNLVF